MRLAMTRERTMINETINVGRGHVPAASRNYQVRTDLFMPTVCRFADGLGLSPPYIGIRAERSFVIHYSPFTIHHSLKQKVTFLL